MCISNNFEFVEHNQITAKESVKVHQKVHLTESGRVFLARNLLKLMFFYATSGLETHSL